MSAIYGAGEALKPRPMSREVILRTRVEGSTAALARVHAERAQMTTSEWIASIIRREISRAGAADALALRSYEMVVTLGYMLRSLMVDAMGAEPTETAVEEASAQAADEAAEELRRGMERA
jgi:hypothetical protein